MSKLVVMVPIGRAFCGRAYIVGADGVTRAGPFRALGTASVRVATKHGNASCSQLSPFGHPATGTYVIAASLPPGYAHKRARRYGRVGGLLLSPTGGDALRATSNGRKLTAIHGGPRDTKKRLRPTRGGVRLSNGHMRALLAAINEAQRDADPVASVEIIEIDMKLARKRDRRGGRKVGRKGAKKKDAAPTDGGVSSMILLPFVLGGAGKSSVARRDMLRAAAIAFGALAIQACERPSRCSPLSCYPYEDGGDGGDGGDAGDAGCRPRGYVCEPGGGVG